MARTEKKRRYISGMKEEIGACENRDEMLGEARKNANENNCEFRYTRRKEFIPDTTRKLSMRVCSGEGWRRNKKEKKGIE